jgi:hypothetical protein
MGEDSPNLVTLVTAANMRLKTFTTALIFYVVSCYSLTWCSHLTKQRGLVQVCQSLVNTTYQNGGKYTR